jgi:hypothetical protein
MQFGRISTLNFFDLYFLEENLVASLSWEIGYMDLKKSLLSYCVTLYIFS